MTLSRAEKVSSPFTEVRQVHREHTLWVVAVSTLSASTVIIAAALAWLEVIA
ncbi:hypothetical protein [Frondihabitans sp. PhB188]|uniref:hypothetical protein n=1 Tax=Frondihabitans sp. PhB188 TaxID=2485200 RepID=UPI0013159723|nr:hypothetical protein [Frondihabitans sp. PhB188]